MYQEGKFGMINEGNIRVRVLENYNESDDLLLYNLGAKGLVTVCLNKKFIIQIRVRVVFEGFNINDFCSVAIDERISGHIVNEDLTLSKIRYVLGDLDELAIKKCLREYVKRKLEKGNFHRGNIVPNEGVTSLIRLVDLHVNNPVSGEGDFEEVVGVAKFKIDDEVLLDIPFICEAQTHSLDTYYKECLFVEPKKVVVEKISTEGIPNIIQLGKIGINDSHVSHMCDVITQEVEKFCTLQVL